jgi:hypothetical protein
MHVLGLGAPGGRGAVRQVLHRRRGVEQRAHSQGLTLVRVRAQLEQLQVTFMSQFGLCGGQRSSS